MECWLCGSLSAAAVKRAHTSFWLSDSRKNSKSYGTEYSGRTTSASLLLFDFLSPKNVFLRSLHTVLLLSCISFGVSAAVRSQRMHFQASSHTHTHTETHARTPFTASDRMRVNASASASTRTQSKWAKRKRTWKRTDNTNQPLSFHVSLSLLFHTVYAECAVFDSLPFSLHTNCTVLCVVALLRASRRDPASITKHTNKNRERARERAHNFNSCFVCSLRPATSLTKPYSESITFSLLLATVECVMVFHCRRRVYNEI